MRAYPLGRIQQQVLDLIRQRPGIHMDEITPQLDVHRGVIHRAVADLEARQLITTQRTYSPPRRSCYPVARAAGLDVPGDTAEAEAE
jgi:DNA-binding MarR family transcriptional regulator